jgi:ABC-type molybdate transport system substrate-binding protein
VGAGDSKPLAKSFYDFVRSLEGLVIFKQWGWSN